MAARRRRASAPNAVGGGARGQGLRLGRWFWVGSSLPLEHGTLFSIMEYFLKTTKQRVSFSPLFSIHK